MRNEDGNPVKVVGIFQDITMHREFDERVHRLNRDLVAIKECNRALVKAQTEQELLDEVCRIVCDLAGYRLAWIGMVEHDEAHSVRPVAQSGYDQGYVAQVKATWGQNDRGKGPIGMSIKTGRTVFIQNMAKDARMNPWQELAIKNGYQSCISMPLMDCGSAFGAFILYSDQIDGFTGDELDLLEEMAGDLGFGIMNMRAQKERRKVEDALKSRDEQYRALFDANGDCTWVIDQETGRIIDVNPAATRMYGYSQEEFVGLDVRDISAEPDKTWSAIHPVQGFVPLRYHKRKDGTVFPVEIISNALIIEGRTVIIGTARDISERLRADEALKESEQRFQNLADNTFEGIAISADGIMIDMNRTLSNMLGYEPNEVIGRKLFDFVTPQSRDTSREKKMRDLGTYEAQLVNKNGKALKVQIRGKNIIWKGKPARFGAVLDVTELKRAEEGWARARN